MMQMPSTRQRRSSGLDRTGEKARVTRGTLFIRYHHQEGTLRISKFGWLAAVIAVAAVVGAVAYSPKPADAVVAAVSKACTPGAVTNQANCVFIFQEDNAGGIPTGFSFTVNMTGAATFTGTPVIAAIGVGPAAGPFVAATCTAAVTGASPTGYTITITGPTAAGCPAVAGSVYRFTVNEVLTVTGAGAVSQTVTSLVSGTSSTVAATGLGVVVPGTGPAQTNILTPQCQLNTPWVAGFPSSSIYEPGQTAVCRIFFTSTLGAATIDGTGSGVVNIVVNVTGIPVNFPLGGGVTTADGLAITAAGSPNSSAASINGNGLTLRCGSPTPGAPTRPVAGVGGCQYVDIVFNSAATAALADTVLGLTISYVPDEPAFFTSASRTFINVLQIRVRIGVNQCIPASGLVMSADYAAQSGLYLPFQRPGPYTINPDGSIARGVFPGASAIGGISGAPLAVGVLPGSINVLVRATNPTYVTTTNPLGLGPVCPGKIEVSSISGTIIDLSGRLTTNLRILCGDTSIPIPSLTGTFAQTAFNLNNCGGVRFSVVGLGVGNVELNARYEPLNPALCGAFVGAGLGIPRPTTFDCREVETVGFVTFTAPIVSAGLTLDPNPVAVGSRGTATASLRTVTTANCFNQIGGLGLAGVPQTTTVGGIIPNITQSQALQFQQCFDPSTGRPIDTFTDPGSVLNGIVVFTVDNTAIARFVEPQTAVASAAGVTGTTLNTAVINTVSQVVRNCGSFGGGVLTGAYTFVGGPAADVAGYFGGCTTATATYEGVAPGEANIAVAFVPFLPGAVSQTNPLTGLSLAGGAGLGINAASLAAGLRTVNFFAPGIGPAVTARTLQVAGAAPATTVTLNLVRGCNNVSPTISESVSAYIARVNPTSAVNSVFQYNAAQNSFAGAPGPNAPAGAAAVADLSNVTRLVPVFVCVSAPATLTQPAL
jgi:hypothetical protein